MDLKKAAICALGAVVLGLAVLLAVNWFRDADSYALPEDMCGVIAPASLEPLLPDGDEIEMRNADVSSAANVLQECQFIVDHDGALTTVVMEWNGDESVVERYNETPAAYGFVGSETTLANELAVVGSDGSLVQVACPGRGENVTIQINVLYHAAGTHGQDKDRRNVETFTKELIPLYSDEYGCG
ncbi:hypothetical protein [Streptomyces sp. NPDC049881]|uniref:hypothetical protein n=1 Tax=Streptomyces sp. NPDC049881 TaxID=3155778 RepID=UPI00342F57E7